MYGLDFYEKTAMMGRNFIAIQKMRVAAGARVRRFREEDQSKELIKIQLDYIRVLTKDEKLLLKQIVDLYKDSLLWAWCERTKGLGPMACATFVGFINPYIADTAGKAKAYMGLIPDATLKAGEQSKFNPGARGRMYVVTTNIIRAQDPYYSQLYYQKKEYYSERMNAYLEDPKLCPQYESCGKRYETAAKKRALRDAKTKGLKLRPGDLTPEMIKPFLKKPSCKAHIDNMAKRWLSGILVSHATEIMRREEGLDISAFHAHKGYIPIP